MPADKKGMQSTQECKDFDKQFTLWPENRLAGTTGKPLQDQGFQNC
jgi:hypothetical protein